jgi:hypothetical protein
MGWSGLDRHAQQLVADVLLLLNLAERGEQPGKIEQWLKRANKDTMPPCIRRDRLALNPDRTVGTAVISRSRSNIVATAGHQAERSWLTSTPPTSQRIPARSFAVLSYRPACRRPTGPSPRQQRSRSCRRRSFLVHLS